MPGVVQPRRAAAPAAISAEEMERRRLIVRKAHHTNQLEGLEPDPDMEPIFEAFVRGEIEAADLVPRIKAAQAAR